MRLGVFSVVDHYPGEIPRSIKQFYDELIAQAQQADSAGFDSFWIAEHHFHEYGAVPRPAVLLGAMAGATKRIRLGSAVAVLPFDDPLRVAEDFAMVDIISSGRLILGVGSGYLEHEFSGFNANPVEKRERFDEALEIIQRAWAGERFSFAGRYYSVKDVLLNVAPLQKPSPEIAVAVLRNESAPFVGAKGFPIMTIPYATTEHLSELASTVEAFSRAYRTINSGTEAIPRAYFGLHCYCAETTEQARAECRQWMDRYVRTRLYAKQRPFDTLIEKNLIACGDPEEILKVARLYQATGLTDFLAITNFGGMPHDRVQNSMRLIAEQVLPALSEPRERSTAIGSF
jgi:alkanesulfonate monooxygenase SsuD/methylene tetrahydromethanopterin reductase-like flavin-dependent oxidoreductase (luciferase family)